MTIPLHTYGTEPATSQGCRHLQAARKLPTDTRALLYICGIGDAERNIKVTKKFTR